MSRAWVRFIGATVITVGWVVLLAGSVRDTVSDYFWIGYRWGFHTIWIWWALSAMSLVRARRVERNTEVDEPPVN